MTDIRVAVNNAQATKNDGAQNISKDEYAALKASFRGDPQSAESLKWLEKEKPQLHAALSSDLDYSGFVGTANHTLSSNEAGGQLAADAARRAGALDKLPDLNVGYKENGLPNGTKGGDKIPGGLVVETGSNITRIKDGKLDVTHADAQKSRGAQTDFTAKMSGRIGQDVSNPPTAANAKAYFQQMAKDGATPAQIQSEYKSYMDTFYKHPGGGVEWKPEITAANVDQRFADQPLGKDGKRLIDCEGYAALTENVLGDLEGSKGQKMFDIKQASNGAHVFTGVFPHGKSSGGFVVTSGEVAPLPLDPRLAQGPVGGQQELALRAYNSREMDSRNNSAHSSTVQSIRDHIADLPSPPPRKEF